MRLRNALAPLGALCVVLLLVSAPAAAGKDTDKFVRTYGFKVEIDGVDAGQFTAVDGLSVEQEVIEYQDGDDPLTRKRPGRVKFGDITLKRGLGTNDLLYDWIQEARKGTSQRRRIVVVELSPSQEPIRTFVLHDCFPIRWSPSSLDGKGSDVNTEEIVIAVEYWEKA